MSRFHLKGSSKERVKVHFEIVFKQAENIPSTGNVYVQWKRGKKNENKGETKHVPVKDKKAVFEQTVEISATLYKIPKKGYESKNISITLKEEKGKKGTSLAKTVVDLAEFAGNKDEKRAFSLKSKKSKVAPTLTLHFKSKERELAPDEDVTETDNVTETSLSDDEEDVEEFTDDAHDDTSSVKSGKSTTSSKAEVKPEGGRHDSKRDSVSSISSSSSQASININTNDIEELRAELEKSKKREADLKKRTRELATENVDFEEKIKDMTKEMDTLKKAKGGASPALSSDKEAELRKRIKELSQENHDLEENVEKLKKDLEDANAKASAPAAGPASPSMPSEKEAQMKKRMRELATENVDLEEQVNALKKELEEAKSRGAKSGEKEEGLQKQSQDELRKKIKELGRANEEAEEEVESLKKQVQQLKRSSVAVSVSSPSNSEELKRLQNELSDKNDKIEDLEREVEKLKQAEEKKRDIGSSRSTDSSTTQELRNTVATQKTEIEKLKRELDKASNSKGSSTDLGQVEELSRNVASLKTDNRELQDTNDSLRDKMDGYREKLKTQQEESERKQQAARTVEIELRDRLKEMEDAADGKLKSSAERDRREKERSDREKQEKDRKAERERYERDLEKERDARRKAEKDAKERVRDLEDKLEELEARGANHVSNGKDDSSVLALEKQLQREKDIVSAVYGQVGQYDESQGVSATAVATWQVLRGTGAVRGDYAEPEDRAAVDRILELLSAASSGTPSDMSMLFYWLSTTCALLHMLRDDDDAQPTNDRDPISDGVYQPPKEPSREADLQARLEWITFQVYRLLISVICNKLTPALPPLIIEKQLTDKKTQVHTSATMRLLDRVLHRTRHHYLYDAVIQQLFVQIFYFINAHLVNTILQKDKLTPSIGFQIKLGISHLEDWIAQPTGSASERALLAPCVALLDGLRDVGGVLVLDKSLFADSGILQSVFKVLSLRQIKRLLEVFEPDQLAQGAIPHNVRMQVSATWNNPQAAFLPLLLDPLKIIPFSPQLD